MRLSTALVLFGFALAMALIVAVTAHAGQADATLGIGSLPSPL